MGMLGLARSRLELVTKQGARSVAAYTHSVKMAGMAEARVVSKEELCKTKFLRMVDIQYQRAPDKPVQHWQSCERTTTDQSIGIDAVAVFSVIKRKGQEPRLLIVKQFRPPLGKYTVELPAGLVDPGESPEVSGLRELKEETGYSGRVVGRTGQQYLSPGLTNENLVTIYVEVDGDLPEHQHPPQQSEEDAEMIRVDTLPLAGLYEALEALEAEGYGVFVGLWSIAQGMRMKEMMGQF